LGRQAANTKLGAKRIHEVRTRGGNRKFRAMRLDAGNFSWGSEAISRKTRIVAVVYNSSNNELVRTGTLVKNAIVQIDATPFRQWYEAHYATPIGARKGKGAVKVNYQALSVVFFQLDLDLLDFRLRERDCSKILRSKEYPHHRSRECTILSDKGLLTDIADAVERHELRKYLYPFS